MAQEKERRLRQLIAEMQLMEGSVNTLQQRLYLLNTAISGLKLAESSLTDLANIERGNPLLIPVGGGIFMNAELGDIKTVIVAIGADVSMEMNAEKAVKDIEERLEEMEDSQKSVREQLSQIITQLEFHQQMTERLSTEIQGALKGAI